MTITRRDLLSLTVAWGAGSFAAQKARAEEGRGAPAEAATLYDSVGAQGPYLTPQAEFGTVERGRPLPYLLPGEQRARAGLTPDTWTLDVISDPRYPAGLTRQFTYADGTGFDFQALLQLAATHRVRFLKTLTCANGAHPLGTGLWEGVPLREVIRLTGLQRDCRRIFYQGYHNSDPKQVFRSSLPADRVFEDPPGVPPVILAYKLNGEPISGKRGGPVRLIVPESYGFKSVKWINLIVLSNRFTANDTYAKYNNTTESWLKTLARFGGAPSAPHAGEAIALYGIAQVGTGGLSKVQVCVLPGEHEASKDPAFLVQERWIDMQLLPPPQKFTENRSEEPGGPDCGEPAFGFSRTANTPVEWPMRFTTIHWAGRIGPLPAGKHTVFCRALDSAGHAQPQPRPLQNSGRNLLHNLVLDVT